MRGKCVESEQDVSDILISADWRVRAISSGIYRVWYILCVATDCLGLFVEVKAFAQQLCVCVCV